MKGRDWLVVVVVIPAFTLLLLYQALFTNFLFLLLSPIVALAYLYFGDARLLASITGLLLNVMALPVGYLLMLILWSKLLCEPGSHDWCQR